MSAKRIVQDWRACVACDLLPGLHGHQIKALADFSYAVALAGHCQADHLAGVTPGPAKPASVRRRFERFLTNKRVCPREVQRQLTKGIMARWSGRTILLILDETPKANDLRSMSLRVAYAKRALPLASIVYRPEAPPRPMPQLVRGLLEQVRGCLPEQVEVVLLADRGLAWPTLVDWCVQHHWHYVLRLLGQTQIRLPDGSVKSARDLAPRVGKRWIGEAEAFKKAGWRGANVVATWERAMKQPWLLLTDQKASLRHCRVYGKRMWIEESFRDDKSSGFHWSESRVTDPQHAGRLLLVLALAMILAASLGSTVRKSGWRRDLDPRKQRRLSLIQLGLRWLRHAIEHELYNLLKLRRIYLYPP